ncbi:MAG: LysM peptidoglycan-binding domain-containing protein [Candidatus Hydrogenedentota bacterium]|nr:MAG: LysM peptidoglycan-binding domain-containing protein [Candidatus Hydrogenedentota bacterium]
MYRNKKMAEEKNESKWIIKTQYFHFEKKQDNTYTLKFQNRVYEFHIKSFLHKAKQKKWIVLQISAIACGLLMVAITVQKRTKIEEKLVKEIGQGVGGFENTNPPKIQATQKKQEKAVPSHEGVSEKDEALKDKLMGVKQDTASEENQDAEKEENQIAGKLFYTVKPGDTLSEIAQRYNVSVASIAGSSQIRIPDDLRVGQKLQIPTKDGFFYTMKKGERLASVLKKHKVDIKKFFQDNPGINPDLLEPGDEVFLPGAKPQNLIYGWLIPVSSRIITSGYGWRRYPKHQFHPGLDLKAPYVPVRATNRGVVKYAGRLGGYGNCVIISHPNGYRTLYGHLSRIYVRTGQRVNRGRVIGRSGNTGYSFGPHLHFEVTRYGKRLNPLVLLKGLRYKKRRR